MSNSYFRLIVLVGISGAGKSTVAEYLAQKTSWPIVSRDTIRAAMFPTCSFTNSEKQAAFEALLQSVSVSSKILDGCIIDGMSFSRVGELERVLELFPQSEELRASVKVFQLVVPIEIAKERAQLDWETGRHVAPFRDASFVENMSRRMRGFPEFVRQLSGEMAVHEIGNAILKDIGWLD